MTTVHVAEDVDFLEKCIGYFDDHSDERGLAELTVKIGADIRRFFMAIAFYRTNMVVTALYFERNRRAIHAEGVQFDDLDKDALERFDQGIHSLLGLGGGCSRIAPTRGEPEQQEEHASAFSCHRRGEVE